MTEQQALADILTRGASILDMPLTDTQTSQLVRYVELLHQWNQTYNLTAVRDAQQMMHRHVLDSLSIIAPLSACLPTRGHLADIGTGGGIPGIVVALMMPELRLSLVESVNKKCRFMTHAVLELGLGGRISVINERVEQWHPERPVDAVICRAFTEPERFIRLTQPLNPAHYFAMTATLTDAQLEPIEALGLTIEEQSITVPFSDAHRFLYIFHAPSQSAEDPMQTTEEEKS